MILHVNPRIQDARESTPTTQTKTRNSSKRHCVATILRCSNPVLPPLPLWFPQHKKNISRMRLARAPCATCNNDSCKHLDRYPSSSSQRHSVHDWWSSRYHGLLCWRRRQNLRPQDELWTRACAVVQLGSKREGPIQDRASAAAWLSGSRAQRLSTMTWAQVHRLREVSAMAPREQKQHFEADKGSPLYLCE